MEQDYNHCRVQWDVNLRLCLEAEIWDCHPETEHQIKSKDLCPLARARMCVLEVCPSIMETVLSQPYF